MEPTPYKLQVANGDIETPTKTITLQFEIGGWNFKETFIVAKRLTGPILGLTFLKNNSAILDVSQGLLHFPHLTYSIETDEYTRNRKLYKVQIKNPLTIPPASSISTASNRKIDVRVTTPHPHTLHHKKEFDDSGVQTYVTRRSQRTQTTQHSSTQSAPKMIQKTHKSISMNF